jgi:hypothetical protein
MSINTKYEKIESDYEHNRQCFLNKLFRGMEFIFIMSTRLVTETYLPIFINETLSDIYGINNSKEKDKSE